MQFFENENYTNYMPYCNKSVSFLYRCSYYKGVMVRGNNVKERQGEDGNSSVISGMVLKLTAYCIS
jgi:hypothetical protein